MMGGLVMKDDIDGVLFLCFCDFCAFFWLFGKLKNEENERKDVIIGGWKHGESVLEIDNNAHANLARQ